MAGWLTSLSFSLLSQAQFFILVTHTVYGIHTGCEYPRSITYPLVAFLASLVVLFGNFYVQSFVRRKRDQKPAYDSVARKQL